MNRLPEFPQTRYKEQNNFCPHMMKLMDFWRENGLHDVLRIRTESRRQCPIMQCNICKVENMCTEIWLGFITGEEIAATTAWAKSNGINL